MSPPDSLRASSRLALVAAALMLAMVAGAVAGGGVTQQHFERAFEPRAWNQELAAATAGTLRWILYFDNLFVIAFSACLVMAARGLQALRPHPLGFVAVGCLLATALLDFGENLHLQVGVQRLMEFPNGLWADRGEIELWSLLSLMKWHLAYAGLFAFSFLLEQVTALERLLVWSLRLGLVPVGVAVGVLGEREAQPLEVARLALMFFGFLMLAAALKGAASRATRVPPPG